MSPPERIHWQSTIDFLPGLILVRSCCVLFLFEDASVVRVELNYHFAESERAEGIFVSLNDVKIVPMLSVTQRRREIENSIYFCLVPAKICARDRAKKAKKKREVSKHKKGLRRFTSHSHLFPHEDILSQLQPKSSVRMNTF